MSPDPDALTRKRRIEPYWYLITLLILIGAALFSYHLATGNTPDRVAFHISSFNFDVYWYGVIIVSGIALGTYVVSRVAADRARWEFNQQVPTKIRDLPAGDLTLPEEIAKEFEKRKITTMGQVLFDWGLNPQRLGLNKEGQEVVHDQLNQHPEVENEWLEEASWHQWNPDFVWSGVAWALAFGIVGARLYHVLTPSPSMADIGINSALDYFRNPLQLVNIRNGGLGIFGAIAGGALGIFAYTKRSRISTIAWTDLAVIGLALGQSIGRWANFINQELYGKPSNLPWAITIDPNHRLPEYLDFSTFHPTFLYASIWSLVTFAVLLWLAKNKRGSLLTGDLTAIYLIMFSLGRIATELFRLDSRSLEIPGLGLEVPVATLISAAAVVILGILLIWRHRTGGSRTKDIS